MPVSVGWLAAKRRPNDLFRGDRASAEFGLGSGALGRSRLGSASDGRWAAAAGATPLVRGAGALAVSFACAKRRHWSQGPSDRMRPMARRGAPKAAWGDERERGRISGSAASHRAWRGVRGTQAEDPAGIGIGLHRADSGAGR